MTGDPFLDLVTGGVLGTLLVLALMVIVILVARGGDQ